MKSELMQRWMELVEYRVTEGSDFCWNCFGENAYRLDSWAGEQDNPSFGILFDRKDQTVFQLEAHDYINNRAYRWTAPSWKEAHDAETKRRNVNLNQAWDDVDYVDLETLDDFFTKAHAIYRGEDYDTRVSVPLDIPDSELFKFMVAAHERDMTFNAFVEEALRHAIEEADRDPEGFKAKAQSFIRESEPHGY